MGSIKFGELLIKAKVLEEEQVRAALAEQKRWGGKLGDVLVRMNLISEDVMVRALSRQLGLPIADVETLKALPIEVRGMIPSMLARDLLVLPLALEDEGRTLVVAMADPLNRGQLESLRNKTHCRISVQIASRSALGRAYARIFDAEDIQSPSGSFKMMDAQGRTVVRAPLSPLRFEPEPAPVTAMAPALRALVELMIDKGVFTREEYLAKLQRAS